MKRCHVHVARLKLKQSTAFYANLCGTPPRVEKPDYAKWMLDDEPGKAAAACSTTCCPAPVVNEKAGANACCEV